MMSASCMGGWEGDPHKVVTKSIFGGCVPSWETLGWRWWHRLLRERPFCQTSVSDWQKKAGAFQSEAPWDQPGTGSLPPELCKMIAPRGRAVALRPTEWSGNAQWLCQRALGP